MGQRVASLLTTKRACSRYFHIWEVPSTSQFVSLDVGVLNDGFPY